MAYDFHYTPTGTGVISGKEVLEQTEDAINDLGNTAISGVQEALDKAEQALTNSENAVDDAQTALNTANNAEGVAIQAQTDVGNLSGTVTNIGNRVTTAEGNISNLQGRMTTAEGKITNIQGRMTTAETNIGNLQTAVSTAQATANSAQQTATTARQQSYVFRYSGTAITDNSTIAYSTIDNTDNIKSGDKILDVDGKLFEITAVDTTNETVTVGSALIDLALDANVVHTSGDETVGGKKTFSENITCFSNSDAKSIICKTPLSTYDSTNTVGDNTKIRFLDKNNNSISYIMQRKLTNGSTDISLNISNTDSNNQPIEATLNFILDSANEPRLSPGIDNTISLGRPTFRYKSFYGMSYYYGSNNVEFSTKFVTTDTSQTISGTKTFSSNTTIYNSDNTANTPNLILQSSKIQLGDTTNSDTQGIFFNAGSSFVAKVDSFKDGSGTQNLQNTVRTRDASNNVISAMYRLRLFNTGSAFLTSDTDNTIALGSTGIKWKDACTYLINGLTPSSLSLPATTGTVDISGYVTDLTGGNNQYTAPANGWISIAVVGTAIDIVSSSWSDSRLRASSGNVRMLYPVLKNETLDISVMGTTLSYARFIPCQGNI